MAESNEQNVFDNITTEVDEAQIKVILATQCTKAQALLLAKLKKQVQRNKETCGLISSANLKLQSEITQAEQKIKSIQTAKATIKLANVELKRELLVAKQSKLDIVERVQNGEKKYEKVWLDCKIRFESLPHVKKLLEATQTEQNLKEQITALDKEAKIQLKEIQAKKEACLNEDRKRVIQLAEFMINERPRKINEINEKSQAITDLMNELKSLNVSSAAEPKNAEKDKLEVNAAPETVIETKIIDECSLIMPKLQLASSHVDDLVSVKLDQMMKKKLDYTTGLERKESFSKSYFDIGNCISNRKTEIDESISSYFSKPNENEEKTQNYSKMKLINILEDVHIDAYDAMDMISKVNKDTLQPVESISAEATSKTNEDSGASRNKGKGPIQSEEIEEIEMRSPEAEDIIVKPPTQFLDVSLNSQKSQDIQKKIVSFDLSTKSQSDAITENTSKMDFPGEKNANANSQLDVSAASDDGYDNIKDMVLKKHNLNLTPPFVYAKKTTFQMKTDDRIVTSMFFRTSKNENDETEQQKIDSENEIQPDKFKTKAKEDNSTKIQIIEVDGKDELMVSSPKKQKTTDELCKPYKPFSGLLFSHGPQGLPDSLDVSISTTEDGDDFPHYIDPSLLLSPKVDLPMSSENPEIESQEAPNFLSGLRKAGCSFFGKLPAGDSNQDSKAPNQGNSGFNFNFGSEEKKNRGGLFSMFQ